MEKNKLKASDASVSRFFLNLSKSYKKELVFIISVATFGSVLTAFVPYISFYRKNYK